MWKKILKKVSNDKNYQKGRDHCHFTGKYRGTAHRVCNLRFNFPYYIPVFFHGYHFLIKELAKEFEGQFECLEENTGKYETFSFPIDDL